MHEREGVYNTKWKHCQLHCECERKRKRQRENIEREIEKREREKERCIKHEIETLPITL